MSFSRESYIKEAKAQNRSEEFIKKTLEYADALTAKNLPVIFSKYHLSLLLKINIYDLKRIISDRAYHYTYYPIKKRSGGVRMICSPYSNLRLIQQWIHEKILANATVSECAKGFKKECSIKDNATPHNRKAYIMNLDLLKFFDSITEFRVFEVFHKLGYAKNVAIDLARLTTVPLHKDYFETFKTDEKKIFSKYYEKEVGVLPQGAPTSPSLSNIILLGLDLKLEALSKKNQICYTRYADDITLSSDTYSSIPSKNTLIEIVKSEGLFVNFSKFKLYRKGQKQRVTGLTIADGIHVPKSYRKDVYRHLHFCLRYGPEDHLKRSGNDGKKFYRDWLLGRINYIHSINPEVAENMYAKFDRIRWAI